MEVGLLTFALVHVITGLVLFLGNLKARPVRYAVNKSAGGRTIGSLTMPYTGIILLAFVVLHLINFHFVDKTDTTIFNIVSNAFTNPVTVGIYIVAMIVAAIHVSHGFWSAFQTIGANHPKYMPLIRTVSIAFAVVVGVGFGFLPIYIFLLA
jgi:succinate dehydrogenase / fumarate reductase cytochrome b subunit